MSKFKKKLKKASIEEKTNYLNNLFKFGEVEYLPNN